MLLRRFAAERPNSLPPMTLVATGLVLIACSILWPRVSVLHGSMSPGGVDFIEGFLVGIGLVFEIMGIGRMVGGGRGKGDSLPAPHD